MALLLIPALGFDGCMATAVRPAVSASTRQHFAAAERLAFWSSVAAAITSAGFGVGTLITLLAFKQQSWTGDISAFARNYDPVQMALTVVPSILLAPSFLIVVAAVHETTPIEQQIWTRLAQMFAVLYVAVVGINYFLQPGQRPADRARPLMPAACPNIRRGIIS